METPKTASGRWLLDSGFLEDSSHVLTSLSQHQPDASQAIPSSHASGCNVAHASSSVQQCMNDPAGDVSAKEISHIPAPGDQCDLCEAGDIRELCDAVLPPATAGCEGTATGAESEQRVGDGDRWGECGEAEEARAQRGRNPTPEAVDVAAGMSPGEVFARTLKLEAEEACAQRRRSPTPEGVSARTPKLEAEEACPQRRRSPTPEAIDMMSLLQGLSDGEEEAEEGAEADGEGEEDAEGGREAEGEREEAGEEADGEEGEGEERDRQGGEVGEETDGEEGEAGGVVDWQGDGEKEGEERAAVRQQQGHGGSEADQSHLPPLLLLSMLNASRHSFDAA
ncbi:unnamed protein product [Closterium sp. Naga37s-1]|nr:unnamed protein product [Closterium sp. Naga37s-1]